MFMNNCYDIRKYAEYGVGLSTEWVFNHSKAEILSIETDEEWIKRVKKKSKFDSRVSITHVDLGPVEIWGRPITYSKRHYFFDYVNAIWQTENFIPDLILIDGRFRVACFLTALIKAMPKTKIIIDDYTNRSFYNII